MVIVKDAWVEKLIREILIECSQNGKDEILRQAAKIAARRRLENSGGKGWTRGKTMLAESALPRAIEMHPKFTRIYNQPGMTDKDRASIDRAVSGVLPKFLAR